jgi:hypothetical protein
LEFQWTASKLHTILLIGWNDPFEFQGNHHETLSLQFQVHVYVV